MKFLLEFMGCCGSCSSTPMVKEEARLLVGSSVPPPPPQQPCGVRGRKRGRRIGPAAARSGHNSSSGVEWTPSLSSICEDNVLHEQRNNKVHHHQPPVAAVVKSSSTSSSDERNLRRKVASTSTPTPKPRSYCSREDSRRPTIHAAMPAFSPTPFMF